jgi:hypothetical protein
METIFLLSKDFDTLCFTEAQFLLDFSENIANKNEIW